VLARCLIDSSSLRPIDRHVITAITIYRIERDLSRNAIFEVYLNEAWMGRGSHGAAAAARAYFGKPLGDLSLDEAAFVAVLAKSPTSIGRNLERDTEWRNRVLDRMVRAGTITSMQAETAKQMPLRIVEWRSPT